MERLISRYTLEKVFIANGKLDIVYKGSNTILTYTDSFITESVNYLYHPLGALDELRSVLETKYNSILNCNGCRIDTSRQYSGSPDAYIIQLGKQARGETIYIFDPTEEISKLCTLKEHEAAYDSWFNSLGK